jgi:hypothetical protein
MYQKKNNGYRHQCLMQVDVQRIGVGQLDISTVYGPCLVLAGLTQSCIPFHVIHGISVTRVTTAAYVVRNSGLGCALIIQRSRPTG